ncbi:glycosyltransferase family 4 protein [Actomonas aquatica]|uniref:Glycosyltransferase family 4 protein n=1 Tax=Actomonas aquatica TaxID=2866162 RepID=A0ABZ1CAD7_9BACT|nr:glycosyltransferase family 4 protein [Opitutus sp. WL0086]WRQ88473.1 glycosyltransferase family 4 protein [Opitutus sp. WL0086]
MSRLLFINRFYRPSSVATAQLLTDMAEQLAGRGQDVSVLTSRLDDQAPTDSVENGVRLLRVRGTRWGNSGNVVAHAIDLLTFALVAVFKAVRSVGRGDMVVIMTDPPLLGLLLQPMLRLRGARIVHWIQDIYPEVIQRVSGSNAARWLAGPRNRMWRNADACITLGEDMARLAHQADVPANRIHLLPNWAPDGVERLAPERATELRREWGLEGKFVILYFGNFGRVHALDQILDLADELRDDRRVSFCLVGPGPQKAALETAATNRGLTAVRFHPAQPRERRSEILALGDVHLVTLKAGCEDVVFPSKLYGICAAGHPVLFIGPPDCEFAQLIQERGLGLNGDPSSMPKLAEQIRKWVEDPSQAKTHAAAAHHFYVTEGNAQVAAERWLQIMARIEALHTSAGLKPSSTR